MNHHISHVRRLAATLVGAVVAGLMVIVLVPGAAVAATDTQNVQRSGSFPCKGDERITFRFEGQGKLSYQWLMGPPHLGYKWKSASAGKSKAMVWRTASINRRDVYSARVVAKTFDGRAPKIRYAFMECAAF